MATHRSCRVGLGTGTQCERMRTRKASDPPGQFHDGLTAFIVIFAIACLGLGAWQRNSWRQHEQIRHIPRGTTVQEVIRRAARPPSRTLTAAEELRQVARVWGCGSTLTWAADTRRVLMYTHFDHPDVYFLFFDAGDRLLRVIPCPRHR